MSTETNTEAAQLTRSMNTAKKTPKYTAAQLATWKRKHRDFRSGSTRAGTAMVMINGGARGCILVPLEST